MLFPAAVEVYEGLDGRILAAQVTTWGYRVCVYMYAWLGGVLEELELCIFYLFKGLHLRIYRHLLPILYMSYGFKFW